jgi:hypothetical protein
LSSLIQFRLLPRGFRNSDLREAFAALLGRSPDSLTAGQMTYHLRRLRLHGLIQRVPRSHAYRVTVLGFRVAFFFTRLQARILRPGLAEIARSVRPPMASLRPHFARLEAKIDRWLEERRMAS